jgi:hypothetical protein
MNQETMNREAGRLLPGAGASAMSVRYEMQAMALAHERLRRFPEQQAEAIGKHYAAHATLALNLLELVRARRGSDDPTNLDAAIAHCVDQIKRNHRHDFGIELEWPEGALRTSPHTGL